MIRITTEQAERAYDILVREAGAVDDAPERASFVALVTRENASGEYRFGGDLGFGGKFKYGNSRVLVDCYREDQTEPRVAILRRTNAALADVFGNVVPQWSR